ncbi:MAG TPA: SMI1/KNR4 family protein [Bacilli bacterium]|nr:SMI1/KNR4 family protein [Bacilli bacterium]
MEELLGTSLPPDYKEFIDMYGTGSINEFLWVLNPFEKNEYLNLVLQNKVALDAYSVSKSQFPEDFPHNVFPESNGLLLWGGTDNGDELFWLTKGAPDVWSLVIYETRSCEYSEYDCTMSQFLYDILSGTLTCEILPDDFSDIDPTFTSIKIE